MDPAIPEGCNIISSTSWDGENNLNGEVVAYEPVYQELGEFKIYDDFSFSINWYAHRVVAEYEEYNMSESSYYINENGFFIDDSDGNELRHVTEQSYESAQELEGSHIIILKGDNHDVVDKEIIPVENVLGVLNEDKQMNIQSLDKWPCSIVNPRNSI